MMGKSDKIEAFITELLKDSIGDDWLELKRNELASIFDCAPSQINYVISTRFNPQRGFVVESRRGGGGYLRIRRINDNENPVSKVLANIGSSADYPKARNYIEYLKENGYITEAAARLMMSAVSDNAIIIQQPQKDVVRASVLKSMLSSMI